METKKLKQLIKQVSLRHLAIIMDGNGRWAKNRGLSRPEGHKIGANRVIDMCKTCDELGIEFLSLYAFSTENWKRPENEVMTIMDLLNKFINSQLDELNKNNVKIIAMGDLSRLPYINRKAVEFAISKTKNNTGLVLNIGINYGSRNEIAFALKKIASDYKKDLISLDQINEDLISNYLYTKDIPDPDLMIRTGGEKRLSNFMLYQLAYSEFYFTDIFWPDFGREELINSISEFLIRNRRFGGVLDE